MSEYHTEPRGCVVLATVFALAVAACGGTQPAMAPGPDQPATGPSTPGENPCSDDMPAEPVAEPGEQPLEPSVPDGPHQPTATPPEPQPTAPTVAAEAGVPANMRGVLAAHNGYRAKHCAPPMTWSTQVAAIAQRWADQLRDRNCAFEHSRGTGLGENLSFFAPVGSGSAQTVVKGWYDEVKMYDFAKPGFGMNTGHFTQVVWKGTTKLGCGVARCNGGELWVCNYAPAGNVYSLFAANVKPTGCTR